MSEGLARSGLPGLDHLLGGGFPRRHIYLVNGPTGSGKTTLGMQFAMEGARAGERTLYVALAETPEEMKQVAQSHGWDLSGITVFTPRGTTEEELSSDQYTLFHPGEVELTGLISQLVRRIREDAPARLVIDSLAEIRLLARDALVLLRQMRGLRAALEDLHCTVLLLDNQVAESAGGHGLQTFAHGIVELDRSTAWYGGLRRCISVVKLRGARARMGQHDMSLDTGGITVYPRLQASPHGSPAERRLIASGSPELDRLCGGGLEAGSSSMIIGPAGTGKSTVAAQYALAAAERGERSALFLFDETERSSRLRWQSMNMPLARYVDNGLIEVREVDPTEVPPGAFCHLVRRAVEEGGVRIVIVDSLSGYMQVMPEMRFMEVHLFELLKFLNASNVLSLLVVTQHGILGSALDSPIDVSYLIDTILLLRFFEAQGEVHKAISVVKKRLGAHERTIRQCQLGENGLRIGKPLAEFQGVLSGIPTFSGEAGRLL